MLVKNPKYVLLDQAQRIAPEILESDSGLPCIAIFGFSDKPQYDAFCQHSPLALTPYPLVKGYLRGRLADAGDATLVVVVDAPGPDESVLYASTMQTVLEAHENECPQAVVTHRLTKNDRSAAYHIEAIGPDVSLQSQSSPSKAAQI
tara:strand:+ start:400293 stop:400733 length:441 start_codon:yes stop_codon:yes gene_type:complete